MTYSNFFLAKCFAAYFGCAMHRNGTSYGIGGSTMDVIMRFGADGWQICLQPVSAISDEHAQRILEMRTGLSLEGHRIATTHVEEGYVIMTAYLGEVPIITENLYYKNKPLLTIEEQDFLRGYAYDIGFSYVGSLIEAGIAIDIRTIKDFAVKPFGVGTGSAREQVLNGLRQLLEMAKATGVPPLIGIISATISAEETNRTLPLFQSMGPYIKHMIDENNRGHQSANN